MWVPLKYKYIIVSTLEYSVDSSFPLPIPRNLAGLTVRHGHPKEVSTVVGRLSGLLRLAVAIRLDKILCTVTAVVSVSVPEEGLQTSPLAISRRSLFVPKPA